MNSNKNNREREGGILDIAFLTAPLVGIFAILLSKDRSQAIKITALLATVVGLIAAVINHNVY
ncbi:hypothetical protein FAZ19_19025 [Sphingobacterium alkalisoli]|uniref:Uncharacterized protein n=1 Tax=Sphingobacterium alkalisoli TaxID=1874115 RepID=A0A4U0GUC4_9SPHI|nr:hypothetical protein [Sphingobacterium alkalisoli]TJY62567.1 hypothetical protein FAZ19_19025 [Sphingobacterium alkalisoli]GGH27482.1 hypothetical protein GCM10011418_37450 [Sphingobacterium alkalisoli]